MCMASVRCGCAYERSGCTSKTYDTFIEKALMKTQNRNISGSKEKNVKYGILIVFIFDNIGSLS